MKDNLPTIYCDMDGVLCDFITQAQRATGMPIAKWMNEPKTVYKSIRDKWKPIKNYPNFWDTMPWTRDGKALWQKILPFQPHILSAYVDPSTDPSCIAGKTKWAMRYLSVPNSRLHLVKRIEKQLYAKTAGRPNLLIDDFKRNVDQWKSKGGIAIFHTSTSNTIRQLQRLGY